MRAYVPAGRSAGRSSLCPAWTPSADDLLVEVRERGCSKCSSLKVLPPCLLKIRLQIVDRLAVGEPRQRERGEELRLVREVDREPPSGGRRVSLIGAAVVGQRRTETVAAATDHTTRAA